MIKLLLIALSLCADSFAVSLCSSVTVKKLSIKSVTTISIIFALIHAGFLLLGWLLGSAFVGLLAALAKAIGFTLLLYVGGSMAIEAIRAKGECRNLNQVRNIILGAIATSIDAIAVGVSQSMLGISFSNFIQLWVCVFIITIISVILGISVGKSLGTSKKLGRLVEFLGGLVLLGIGVSIWL